MTKLLYTIPPKSLQTIQEWFAGIILQPLQDNSEIAQIAPNGKPISEEATLYIAPSPTRQPHKRIEIYNQQYWWRLLNNLQEGFPLLVRLFGYTDFNQSIAVPYLMRYRPNHWSLNQLGSRLGHWILEAYLKPDQQLVYHCACLDEAFTASFVASEYPPIEIAELLKKGGTDQLLSQKLYLQPHITIFQWDYDLFSFRTAMLKEDPEYWLHHDFAPLSKDQAYSFVFFRGKGNNLYWKRISTAEAILLTLFKKGSTVEKACESLEKESEEIYEQAIQNLQEWFKNWAAFGWFTNLDDSQKKPNETVQKK